ncbi:c-Myc-binding protein homolog [Cucurbita pepo subsp. pepo]|uniref:c-Myc-binding protein homolog n=1 Tax=Cucurbita pepo subsp. pepo TaxID=3664 RepID=UPI000C9D992F|nr:c-Myc-binding protein homolog [Cucurbita pepo subsp. pepo]
MRGKSSDTCRPLSQYSCENGDGFHQTIAHPTCKQLWRRNLHFFPMGHIQEKEAKKEAFRKYLESNGVVDALTKVLVALFEQNDKPSSALEFIQQRLGGPSIAEYEKLQSEMADLQVKYDELLATHKETCKELEGLKSSHNVTATSTKDTTDDEEENDKV